LKKLVFFLAAFLTFYSSCIFAEQSLIKIQNSADSAEIERIVSAIQVMPVARRIEFVSKYLLGRKYRPETKSRIKKQKSSAAKVEATNSKPLVVDFLKTGLKYLDCMTYVEHVLAIASCEKPDYKGEFLPHLVNIRFDANGKPLMNHYRNHFTSHWGDNNERKGYLKNVARNHKDSQIRYTFLNKVGDNRTFYVSDAYLMYVEQQPIHFFPIATVLRKNIGLRSGDILAFVTDKEGLDVTHMAFFIKKNGKSWLRHASLKHNRVVDQGFYNYLQEQKKCLGLMVFRPILRAKSPPKYLFKD
jgi:hypothetical protein